MIFWRGGKTDISEQEIKLQANKGNMDGYNFATFLKVYFQWPGYHTNANKNRDTFIQEKEKKNTKHDEHILHIFERDRLYIHSYVNNWRRNGKQG